MKTSPSERVAAAVELVQGFVPEFKLAPKSSSLLHRSIGKLFGLLGNKDYCSRFWTTLKFTAAYPDTMDEGWDAGAWTVVLHEGMHAVQRKRSSTLAVNVRYGMPQLLALPWAAVCVLAAVLGFWTWWLLLGLIFLAPLPSWGRAQIELEAYRVSVAVDETWWGGIKPRRLNSYVNGWLVDNFVGPNYYYMFPFKRVVWSWFVTGERLKEIPESEYLSACKELALRFNREDFS